MALNGLMARILVAEDDSSMRFFLEKALARAGHEVTVADDGVHALQILTERKNFDLLLADIVMPGMDGIELSQKATDLMPGLKVMFITGFAAVAMNQKDAAPRGQARVMSKPFHLNELVGQIDDILAA